jgi:predicted small secreted protein
MKKLIPLLILVFICFTASSQTLGKDIKRGAKKVGNKTAQVASKGTASVKDKKVKDKTGPNGEEIWVDKHSKYYFIDKKGKKHYVSSNSLKRKAIKG